MNQILKIENFGPVSNLELDLKDILVFIGEQASGKSTIGKAVFFFKSLRDDLSIYFYQCYNKNQFDHSVTNFAKQANQKFIKIYGSVLHFPEMKLEYHYGSGMEVKIQSSENKQHTDIIFNYFFTDKFRELIERLSQENNNLKQKRTGFSSSQDISKMKAEEAALFEQINNEINLIFNEERDILFLPAGRSLITTLSQQRYNIDLGSEWNSGDLESETDLIKIDYLMQNFISRVDNAKLIFDQNFDDLIRQNIDNFEDNSVEIVRLAQEKIKSILKGSYHYYNGTERIYFGDNQSTLINFASSGQQEVIWLLLLVLLLILNQRKVFLVIEEPEAHLFPIAQKEIIDLIALLANQNSNQILLTTHSPYILSSFNNLLYAHNLGTEKAESVAQVVDPHLWIDPDRLDAYILEQGKARSIFDSEMRLIESAEIDKASDIIVDTFNQLFELED
jgi:predicted ATPase